jgi:hypothetical protein
VSQLNAGAGALRVEKAGDPGQRGDVRILPDAKIAGGDAALGQDCRGFKNYQAGATLGAAPEVDEMPLAGESVHRRVLAHGRNTDAVREGNGTQLERREKWVAHKFS